MRFPHASDTELIDVISRYVTPESTDHKRYLKLLHGNFQGFDKQARVAFLHAITEDARRITDHELGVLLESEWRSRLTAAWLIGADRRAQFRERLGELLHESELVFACQGYCLALARLATNRDAEILVRYLDEYLPRIDCRYDQNWAIGALLHIDDQLQTRYATQYLQSDGLWEQWSGDQFEAAEEKRRIDELCSLIDGAESA